jgi:hypothetical protein
MRLFVDERRGYLLTNDRDGMESSLSRNNDSLAHALLPHGSIRVFRDGE